MMINCLSVIFRNLEWLLPLKVSFLRSWIVKVDWKNVSPKEIQKLSEDMFDAAKVPELTRSEYYRQLNKYLYTLD